ncbi:MAG: DNA alkylation repair protein [Candidatus Moranbacteria bacterium]|nr:DNA alkylation repair protein [Candidatus Moranbacteria bacterium]MBP7696018.1 DNA alkylation repair protein [Candidatus Moranbacteria bacterium]
MTAENVKKELKKASDNGKVAVYQRFFKTGPGEYGEGDRFIGVTVPKQRIIAKKYQSLPLYAVAALLASSIHEHRLTGLLILTYRFPRASEGERQEIFDFYLSQTERINNWDLVDATAPTIVGEYLIGRDCSVLKRLAVSDSLWERRIAILSTFAFIRRGRHKECFELAKILMRDQQDLMHKAVGWMLREVGKRCDEELLRGFLDQHAARMPRTMLRYAIERLPEPSRKHYLAQPKKA